MAKEEVQGARKTEAIVKEERKRRDKHSNVYAITKTTYARSMASFKANTEATPSMASPSALVASCAAARNWATSLVLKPGFAADWLASAFRTEARAFTHSYASLDWVKEPTWEERKKKTVNRSKTAENLHASLE